MPRHETSLDVWKLVESDENAANLRAELVLDSQLGAEAATCAPRLHTVCCGHKCHQIATKTWEWHITVHDGIASAAG